MTQILPKNDLKLKNILLLAADNPDVLKQVESIFSSPDYSLIKISSPNDLEQPFDMLICEEKYLHIAKQCQSKSSLPLCIILSEGNPPNVSGNMIYLKKPFDNILLKQIVDTVLNYSILLQKNKELDNTLQQKTEQLNLAMSTLNSQQKMSSHIQRTMLFGELPTDIPGCEVASMIEVSQDIDSDFLDFFQPLSHIIDVVIGDVMGKGLGSSLVGIATKLQISRFANRHAFPITYTRFDGWQEEIPTLNYVIEKTHKSLVPLLMEIEHFVSLMYGRFNLKTRQFSYIDCGFTNPIFYRNKLKKAVRIPSYHFPLGVIKNYDYKEKSLSFEENDLFLFFSDGIIEVQSPEGQFFGEKSLCDLVEAHSEKHPKELIKIIHQELTDFSKNGSIRNDLTLFAIKFANLDSYKPAPIQPAKFNSVISQLHPVRQLVKEYCHKAPGNYTLLATELELVIDEAFSNIVKHGYKNIPGGSIILQVEYQKDGMILELADQGISYNPAEIPHPNLFGDNETGYGWFLIKHLVDHIIYFPKSTNDSWNRLRLYKKYFNKEAQMELSHQLKNDILVVTLEGENLDTRSIFEFKDKVAHLLASKGYSNVIFDLHQVKFIDSSGLGAFLSILRQLNTKGGQLKLARLTPPVKSIFELVSMQKLFECYSSTEDAVNSFKNGSNS